MIAPLSFNVRPPVLTKVPVVPPLKAEVFAVPVLIVGFVNIWLIAVPPVMAGVPNIELFIVPEMFCCNTPLELILAGKFPATKFLSTLVPE